MTESSSPTAPWVGLLKHVLDDDDRTRRAELLLSHLTTWLVVIGAVAVTGGVLLLSGPWWVSAGAGGVGLVSGVLAWLRRRRRLLDTAAQAGLAQSAASHVLAVDRAGAETAAAS